MAASLYSPDEGATLEGLDYIKILSQRDLSSQIPINFVTIPGVSLRAACFPFGRYGTSSSTKCFSNLLANGFRRFDVDLYWDASRSTWTFCPVELGFVNPTLSSTQGITESSISTSSASLMTGVLTAGEQSSIAKAVRRRQDSTGITSLPRSSSVTSGSTSTISTASSTLTLASSTGEPSTTSNLSQPSYQDVNGESLIQVGNYYSCSPSLNFRMFLNVLEGHLEQTEDTLNATMKYLILNLHAAAPASDPDGPADQPEPEDLPKTNNVLSNLISANNSQYLYSPENLFSQRTNLNDSGGWYTVDRQQVPDSAYFQLNPATDYSSTPDGWPSESFVEFAKAKRFLAGFGQVGSSMSEYNFSADSSTIFPAGFLQDAISVDFDSDGDIESGCFYHPEMTQVDGRNSSWATAAVGDFNGSPRDDGDIFSLSMAESTNLTDCGIAPILNTTLGNATADVNYNPYKAFVLGTIWSWDVDEPKNMTSDPDDRDSSTANRCAVLNATSDRWQAHDCDNQHRAACRVRKDPYNFKIFDDRDSYYKGMSLCQDDTTFTAPRTSLENNYLIAAWHAYRSDRGIDDELLWVDFNDLNTATCWVIGQNATCPYQPTSMDNNRQVIVPTVAAVIVFVIALLLVFVKCAANRRNTRRRRKRGDDGWDYEGVPS